MARSNASIRCCFPGCGRYHDFNSETWTFMKIGKELKPVCASHEGQPVPEVVEESEEKRIVQMFLEV